ncbi:MAG: sigma-70 family RNA polymerase sigma factor, partial [Candidatus Omnitrophota bacterium]|nr:sigma-70 family RNA polymerase sigma factor [Candidatus Omnitrophota bacterium]
FDSKELLIEIVNKTPKLNSRDKEILELYFFEKWTMKKIGEKLEVTETRISQIIKEILSKLRKGAERIGAEEEIGKIFSLKQKTTTKKDIRKLSDKDCKEVFCLRFGLSWKEYPCTWKEIKEIKQTTPHAIRHAIYRVIRALKENPVEVRELMDELTLDMPFKKLSNKINGYIETENNRDRLIHNLNKICIKMKWETEAILGTQDLIRNTDLPSAIAIASPV